MSLNKSIELCNDLIKEYYEHKLELDESATQLRDELFRLIISNEVTGRNRATLRDISHALDANLDAYEEAVRKESVNVPGAADLLQIKKYDLTSSFENVRDFLIDLTKTIMIPIKPSHDGSEKVPSGTSSNNGSDELENQLIKRITENPEDDTAYNALGNHYFSKKKFKEAITQYEIAYSKCQNFVYETNIGDSYRVLGENEKAIMYYLQALELKPNDDIANNMLGVIYFGKNEYSKAKSYYREAITSNPQPVYFVNMGLAYAAENNYGEAINFYQNALSFDKNYLPAHIELANTLLSKYLKEGKNIQDLEDARNHYEKALDIDPQQFRNVDYVTMGEIYIHLLDYQKALDCFEEAKKIPPELSRTYNGIGNIHYSQGNTDQAIDNYKKAFELEPTYYIYAENIGGAYVMKKDFSQAAVYYEKAHKLNPKDNVTLEKLGEAYFLNGKYDQANKIFNDLVITEPDNFLANYWIGMGLMVKAQWDAAIPYLKRATELNPNDSLSFFKWGEASYYKGLLVQAAEKFREAMRLSPDNPVVYDWLALIYSRMRNWDTALDFAFKSEEKARMINPDNNTFNRVVAGVYNERGLYLAGIGRYSEAIEDYKQAFQRHKDPVYLWNIYVAYKALKDKTNAKEYLIKAVDLEPKESKYHNVYLDELRKL
jgi:tetratricopeptide (TPR) repeat protein